MSLLPELSESLVEHYGERLTVTGREPVVRPIPPLPPRPTRHARRTR